MPYRYVRFVANEDISVFSLEVREEIEGEEDGAVGAVFKGNDASVCCAGLYGREDVLDCDEGSEGCCWRVLRGEGGEGGLMVWVGLATFMSVFEKVKTRLKKLEIGKWRERERGEIEE